MPSTSTKVEGGALLRRPIRCDEDGDAEHKDGEDATDDDERCHDCVPHGFAEMIAQFVGQAKSASVKGTDRRIR